MSLTYWVTCWPLNEPLLVFTVFVSFELRRCRWLVIRHLVWSCLIIWKLYVAVSVLGDECYLILSLIHLQPDSSFCFYKQLLALVQIRACERSWAVRISAPRSRGCSLHRSKSDQIALLNSVPRSSTISSRSGEIAPRSLKFKITLHA